MRVLLLFPLRDRQTGPAIMHAFQQLGHIVQAVDAKTVPRLSFKTACDFKPDLVFCSRTDVLADQVVRIKQKFPNAVACTWQVDTRGNIGHWKHLFPLIRACDYYFVVASGLIPEWKNVESPMKAITGSSTTRATPPADPADPPMHISRSPTDKGGCIPSV